MNYYIGDEISERQLVTGVHLKVLYGGLTSSTMELFSCEWVLMGHTHKDRTQVLRCIFQQKYSACTIQ